MGQTFCEKLLQWDFSEGKSEIITRIKVEDSLQIASSIPSNFQWIKIHWELIKRLISALLIIYVTLIGSDFAVIVVTKEGRNAHNKGKTSNTKQRVANDTMELTRALRTQNSPAKATSVPPEALSLS